MTVDWPPVVGGEYEATIRGRVAQIEGVRSDMVVKLFVPTMGNSIGAYVDVPWSAGQWKFTAPAPEYGSPAVRVAGEVVISDQVYVQAHDRWEQVVDIQEDPIEDQIFLFTVDPVQATSRCTWPFRASTLLVVRSALVTDE